MRILVAVHPLTDPAIVGALANAGLAAESVATSTLAAAATDGDVAACVISLATHRDVARIYALKKTNPRAAILALADDHADTRLLTDALGFGAGIAFAHRPADAIAPLQALLRGEMVIPQSLLQSLVDTSLDRVRAKYGAFHLTHRESTVCELLEEGRPTAVIAHMLTLSPVTVRRHIGSAMQKVGAHDRTELLAALHKTATPGAPVD